MKYLVALPDNSYFLWQMLVQMNNFKELGIDKDLIYVIGKNSMQKSSNLLNIITKSNTLCSFFVYHDERVNPQYSSTLRPHILAKFFTEYPNASDETFFYLDPDVIFTKKIKTSDLEKNDTWYLSDTRSYINSMYIKSKSNDLFVEMCDIVGIDPDIVEGNDDNAGGAQYIMKNLTAEFWEKVEIDSENLYNHMVSTSTKYNPEHPIQAWTADMWAVLWNAWYFKHDTKIIKRLDFCWATDVIEKWSKTNIYHNAGAVIDNDFYFLKTKYQISPFGKKIKCSKDYCSHNYLKEIKKTEKTFKDILF
jgi:hypothetical protein